MGYDFHLFRVPLGVNAIVAYAEQLKDQEAKAMERMAGIDNRGLIDPSKEQIKEQLARALLARRPSLKLVERDYAQLAKAKSIDESEARRQFRELELNERGLGLQVTIFDDSAAVQIPFWRADNEKAEKTLRAAWECLKILESAGGFTTYDPQAGRILKLDSDFSAILKAYRGLLDTVDRALRNSQ